MRLSLRDVAMIPVMTALVVALGALPKIPVSFLPVPITAQTLGVMMAGIVLGSWRGGLSQILFLLLVAAGVPALAGGRGGLAPLLGPGAGFIWAFPIGAWLTGFLVERTRSLTAAKVFVYSVVGGIGATYAVGIPLMAILAPMPLQGAFTGSVVFLPGDLIKAAIATWAGLGVLRGLRAANLGPRRSYDAAD